MATGLRPAFDAPITIGARADRDTREKVRCRGFPLITFTALPELRPYFSLRAVWKGTERNEEATFLAASPHFPSDGTKPGRLVGLIGTPLQLSAPGL